jgi:serine/threonine protein kinase
MDDAAGLVNACLELAKVVRQLHERDWIHCDIRASNVFVTFETCEVWTLRVLLTL